MASFRFEPAKKGLNGTRPLQVPADKSISHRAAMIAALCDSKVEIRNFLEAADTLSTLEALKLCGVDIQKQTSSGHYLIEGRGLSGLTSPDDEIYVGNSGTSIRLLPGIFAGQHGCFTLDGDASIRRRPMDRIVEPLSLMGVDIKANGGFAPLTVCGGQVRGIDYELPVASAQVKSAILFAGLFADRNTQVREPTVTRNHTEILLKKAGATIQVEDLRVTVSPVSSLHLENLTIPNDFSSAAFFIVAATIIKASQIALDNIGTNPTRTGLLDILADMGQTQIVKRPAPHYMIEEDSADLHVSYAPLKGVSVDGSMSGRTIDELPLLALAGAFASGDTIVTGAAELKLKESDRIASTVENLTNIGAKIEALDDGFLVHGGTGLRGGKWKSYGDHRIAMMGAIAGLASDEGVTVEDFDCVSISYPNFINDIKIIGGIVRQLMIVAIDGPAGAGKSTISRLLADRYGWTYLDTGALYRTITLLSLEQGIAPDDGGELGQLARNAEISFQPGPGGAPRVFAGCREVTAQIREPEVSRNVSEVSAHQEVRDAMMGTQRACIEQGDVIVDGRDIGTVVCPEADVKIFLTASVEERARRRRVELEEKGTEIPQDQMEREIAARDAYDSSRAVAPLRQARDAIVVDTTDMNIEQVVETVSEIIAEKRLQQGLSGDDGAR